jgi:tetratricopeptide (TPR) repeat protein
MPAIRQHAGAPSLASAQENLARAELLLGRPEVARRHAVGALRGLEPEARLERARALAVLGAASVALGEDAAGVESLESAAALLAEGQAPRQAAAVWRQLSEVYRALGDSERALDAAERAMDALGVLREPVVPAVSDARRRGRAARAVPSRASGPGAGRR